MNKFYILYEVISEKQDLYNGAIPIFLKYTP